VADPDRVLSAAQADRDDAAAVLAAHERDCKDPWCCDCVSLAAHLDRATRQLTMLTPTAEPDPLF